MSHLLSLTWDEAIEDPARTVSILGESIWRNVFAEWVLYLLLAVAIGLALTADLVRRRDLRERYMVRSVRLDVLYGFLECTHIIQFVLVVPLGAAIALALKTWTPWIAIVPVGSLPVVVQWVAVFLLTDLAVYWWHRWQHSSVILWQFHKTHHSQTNLNVFTVFRATLVDRIVQILVLSVISAVLGVDYAMPVAIAVMLQLHQLIEHADTGIHFGPLERLFVSPSFHEVHHSSLSHHLDRNFASVLPVWDHLFGTHAERGDVPLVYGLADERLPESYFGQQLVPVIGLWRLWRGRANPGKRTLVASEGHPAS